MDPVRGERRALDLPHHRVDAHARLGRCGLRPRADGGGQFARPAIPRAVRGAGGDRLDTGSTLFPDNTSALPIALRECSRRGGRLGRCRGCRRPSENSIDSRKEGMMWPSKLLSIILPLIGLYALMVGALYVLQRPMIFRADMSPAPPDLHNVPGFQEVSHRTEDGLDLRALFRPAAPGTLTLVYFHGNADGLTGSLQVTERLAAKGYGLLLVGYRGYDGNPGSPTESGLYADGRSAMRWLSDHGVAISDTILVGNSLGSGPATEMA